MSGLKHNASPAGPVIQQKISQVVTYTTLGTATVTDIAVTVSGVRETDVVHAELDGSAAPAGAGLIGSYVSAADTVQLSFVNPTAAAIAGGTVKIVFDVSRYSA